MRSRKRICCVFSEGVLIEGAESLAHGTGVEADDEAHKLAQRLLTVGRLELLASADLTLLEKQIFED
jgi:hypothetical protein